MHFDRLLKLMLVDYDSCPELVFAFFSGHYKF